MVVRVTVHSTVGAEPAMATTAQLKKIGVKKSDNAEKIVERIILSILTNSADYKRYSFPF